MSFKNFLAEQFTGIMGIYKNPTPREVDACMAKDPFKRKEIRVMIYDNKDLYIWPAFTTTHFIALDSLGLNDKPDTRWFGYTISQPSYNAKDTFTVTSDGNDSWGNFLRLWESPMGVRAFKGKDFRNGMESNRWNW